MKHLALLPLLAVLCAAPAFAQPANVAVTGAWARGSAGPAKTGIVYATVTASQPDRLMGASTPVAGMAELHQTINAGGVMQMRPLEGGLAVTPGTPAHLQPGGYHIMLMDLKQPLKKGEHFPITLTFEHAAPVTTQVTVMGPGAMGPGAMGPGAMGPGAMGPGAMGPGMASQAGMSQSGMTMK